MMPTMMSRFHLYLGLEDSEALANIDARFVVVSVFLVAFVFVFVPVPLLVAVVVVVTLC